jgi:PAS domain S-box-containing protein
MSNIVHSDRILMDSERSFRLLVEGVVDYAIYLLDRDGIITNWNAGAQRIKGYCASEVVGRHFGMFYLPEDREADLPARSLETARRTGRFETEGWRLRKDGSRFLACIVIDAIYESGALIGFAKITRDITERKQAETALSSSENLFRLLVAGVTDYALYMLDPSGIVTSWNAGGQRIKGYAAEEIIGQHFSRFYSEADRANGRPAQALEAAEKCGRYEEEGWRVRKDGSFFWASVVIDVIRDDSGRLLGFAKITRDITERRQAQQNLEKIQRQLAESKRMDALGQLTSGVAHDFNNILMIVGGSLHALKKLASGDPRGSRAVVAMETAVKRGAALTGQLLSFAGRQLINPESIDVATRVNGVCDALDTGLGGTLELLVDAQPNLWSITVDVAEFETTLVNLVLNARDAMPDGGSVTVRAGNVERYEEPRGDYVAISVTDTGIGIPKDVLGSVFDPFFTTKPVGKGTGLGLSQVRGFVQQAEGHVELSSEMGKGTTVTIWLPRGYMVDKSHEEVAITRAFATVLLVEDNPDVAQASAELLEQLGYSVRWACNAEKALMEIECSGIDLVFSDIVMPGKMDGLKLAHAIRDQRPALPILLTTGYSDATLKARSEFPILRKPYQIHELSRALATVSSLGTGTLSN